MASHGWEGVTAGQLLMKQAQKKPSKYRNVKVTLDGVEFDSKKEAAYYQQLKTREKAGDITDMRVHPVWFLAALGGQCIAQYEADFSFHDAHGLHVVDVKSVATRRKDMYRLKAKWMKAQFGIEVEEV